MPSLNFTVDSALLRELGERLVGKPHIALAELVKNSYDADATKVIIRLLPDRIEILDNGQVRLHPDRHGVPPLITLCDDYKLIEQLDALGVPSLRHCRSLTITGPAHFPPGSVLTGDVTWSGPMVAAANE